MTLRLIVGRILGELIELELAKLAERDADASSWSRRARGTRTGTCGGSTGSVRLRIARRYVGSGADDDGA